MMDNDEDDLADATPESLADFAMEIYDVIRDIRDPEKPQTLEDLGVVDESSVVVQRRKLSHPDGDDDESLRVRVAFSPTVPHCSLAALIGLCIRTKISNYFGRRHKVDVFVRPGSHDTEDDVNKQINDKERVAAAMENEALKRLVDGCIEEDGDG